MLLNGWSVLLMFINAIANIEIQHSNILRDIYLSDVNSNVNAIWQEYVSDVIKSVNTSRNNYNIVPEL